MTWHTIANACEKAGGPDRDLDAMIHYAAGGTKSDNGFWRLPWQNFSVSGPQKYTADLNTIVALIERLGLYYRISKNTPAEASAHGKAYWATCGNPGEQESADSNHRALALCTALARAMAEKEGE